MARFDVYVNKDDTGTAPFLVDVQSEFLAGLSTTVVVPLIRADSHPGARLPPDLIPPFEFQGIRCVFYPPFMAAVPRQAMGERVGSLHAESGVLVTAIDRLMGAF
ncbi:MAG TPA: CcdB family protein [Dyella sp.]|uniref:CcdB family protein n=1 Tax=Dyella sp. TaxID=1869338 RepID=UPI002D78582B|nr:CcdB family protein [Dyella sp.]HET6554179.1 CcdB family protein [Dyella sp.]